MKKILMTLGMIVVVATIVVAIVGPWLIPELEPKIKKRHLDAETVSWTTYKVKIPETAVVVYEENTPFRILRVQYANLTCSEWDAEAGIVYQSGQSVEQSYDNIRSYYVSDEVDRRVTLLPTDLDMYSEFADAGDTLYLTRYAEPKITIGVRIGIFFQALIGGALLLVILIVIDVITGKDSI